MVRDVSGRKLWPTEGQVVKVVCANESHGRLVVARLLQARRWDGQGFYWVKATRMTAKEARAYQAAEPGDGSQMPRGYREPTGDGFYWRRDGDRVTDAREARIISAAAHHASGENRTGPPVPGILEGIDRRFELNPCECGRGGTLRAPASAVEDVLNRLVSAGIDEVDVQTFRKAVASVA